MNENQQVAKTQAIFEKRMAYINLAIAIMSVLLLVVIAASVVTMTRAELIQTEIAHIKQRIDVIEQYIVKNVQQEQR